MNSYNSASLDHIKREVQDELAGHVVMVYGETTIYSLQPPMPEEPKLAERQSDEGLWLLFV